MYVIELSDGTQVERQGDYDWCRSSYGTHYDTMEEASDAQRMLQCGGRIVEDW